MKKLINQIETLKLTTKNDLDKIISQEASFLINSL